MKNKNNAFQNVNWEGEDRIIFSGLKDPKDKWQVYSLNIATGKLDVLATEPESVGATKVTDINSLPYLKHANALFYTQQRSEALPKAGYPSYPLSVKEIDDLVMGRESRYVFPAFVRYGDRPAWKLESDSFGLSRGRVSFSSDGRQIVAVMTPKVERAEWEAYDGVKKKSERYKVADRFGQFNWIDVLNKKEVAAIGAPTGNVTKAGTGIPPKAFWSEDGRATLLVNTALPLTGKGGDDPERRRMAYIVSFQPVSHTYDVLAPVKLPSGARVKDSGWLQPGKQVLVTHEINGKPAPGTVYTYNNSKWTAKSVDASVEFPEPLEAALADGVSVTLREGPEQPPMLVASKSGREVPLLEPDPALHQVGIASIKPFHWKDKNGTSYRGGLLLPREVPADGRRLPLVVQIDNYDSKTFVPDGGSTTAFAAQALAAQGMAVLFLLNGQSSPEIGRPPEKDPSANRSAMFREMLDSAVIAAAREHPIDLDRVGVMGFSFSGYLVQNALAQPGRVRLKAALAADSYTGSYTNALMMYATENSSSGWRSFYGGKPFLEDKSRWLEYETSFNVDRVEAPILFAENHERAIMFFDRIGAFKAAKKPFDFIIFPKGQHNLVAPRQRESSMATTVDWMNFWLQGRVDPDPSKADQYMRWRILRVLYDKNQAEAAKKTATSTPSISVTPKPESKGDEVSKVREEMQSAGVTDPGTDRQALNLLAYKTLYDQNDPQTAMKYFQWNIVLFPRYRWWTTDSLAEGYLQLGDVEKTIEFYSKALQLNPKLPGAGKSIVERLKADPKTLPVIQEEMRKAYLAEVAKQASSQ